ncbi:MAG: adenylate/guanylate cyclase domain-containing protein [Candidatus Marinimicrobia bacterium]|nr:adenylate/guanylate cyclase domain-containing protein [Candidatus Neomarinimicrobiota bacterium]
MIDKLRKIFDQSIAGILITAGTIVVVAFLHWLGVFDTMELKLYDYRFHTVRGPLTGWAARDSSYIKMGTDVVLVEVDDEAWRLMPEQWPYPRGTIWANVVRNLSQAGAKVIAFDIQFDAPEAKSDYIEDFIQHQQALGFEVEMPPHGDDMFGEAITEAMAHGTEIVINVKMVTEPSRYPPQYISMPVEALMRSNPETGLINDFLDEDGFARRYSLAGYMNHEPNRAYLTLGLKCVKAFTGIADTVLPVHDFKKNIWQYGPFAIKVLSRSNTFLTNYYGPASGYKLSNRNVPKWGTFSHYSLAYIIDTEEITLRDPMEDIDWMDQFLPGKTPEWIEAIEDPVERQEMMEVMGIGDDFDLTQSPFYGKIVLIGVSVETIHDVKSTPFYNYLGVPQLMPGVETHADAIQTILHGNYLNVLGDRLVDLLGFGYPMGHIWLLAVICLITFITIAFVNPVIAGILILIEAVTYFGLACGFFVNDLWWFVKMVFTMILPDSFIQNHLELFTTALPGIGESLIIPIVMPIAGIALTYTSNVIYKFLNEQKDKKFLKNTFGTYISPELIDQMYENKREPKLGGDAGYHTAFFSDIQSFSSFSEVLEPTKMVSLMNEYLTEMTTVLLNRQGTLDKYIGDSIVAFYGSPMPVEDHEYQACMTALEMEKELIVLRAKWKSEEGWPEIVHNMQHRIGLGSGKIVTGNMGSTMRMNYTMMGDTVNIASRLESSAKQYGVYIQVLDTTYAAVKDKFEWRFLDYVRVKGKNVPVKVYELLSEKDKLDRNLAAAVAAFHEAQALYLDQDWNKAIKAFKAAEALEIMFPGRNTNPSTIYIPRCEQMKKNPPGKDWDGTWTLTAK